MINYTYSTVSLLPGWLPRLAVAQTLPYPHGTTHRRYEHEYIRPKVIKTDCTVAKVSEQPVSAFILNISHSS